MLTVFSKLRTFLLGQEIIETERRRAVRIPCRMKAAVDSVPAVVTVVNLSVLGMRIECSSRLRKNSLVTVQGRDHSGKSIFARVVWCQSRGSQYQGGLMFVGTRDDIDQSWIRVALDKLGAQNRTKEKRTHVRVSTQGIATLTRPSGERLCKGTVRNIGLGGALFSSDVGVAIGTPVSLQLESGGRSKLNELSTVRSCRKEPRSQQFLIGLQFHKVGEEGVRKFMQRPD